MNTGMSILDYLHTGGPLMWVLLVASVLSVGVIIERAAVYLWYGLRPGKLIEAVLAEVRGGRNEAALRLAQASRHPIGRVLAALLERVESPAEVRKEAVARIGGLALEKVEANLRLLAASAHLAPLLGLLGTVTGMVTAFAQIEKLTGGVKPSDLAGGIWEALLTTVFGLLVAIPAMAAFHAFESHADKIARRMEWAVGAVEEALGLAGCAKFSPQAEKDDWTTVA